MIERQAPDGINQIGEIGERWLYFFLDFVYCFFILRIWKRIEEI